MRLQQLLGRIELGADAEIGGAVEHAPIGEAAADGVDAEFGTEIGAERDVGGGVAELAAALVAMLDHPFDGEGAGEEAGGGFAVTGFHCPATAAGVEGPGDARLRLDGSAL